MKAKIILAIGASLMAALAGAPVQPGGYEKHDDSKLLAALPKSMYTLEAGIKQAAAKAPETAISAKFEMDDKGELSLSVYVAEKGLNVDAEHNVLKELSGSPAGDKWSPEAETFGDVEHVSRASQQLAIMALSPVSLADVVKKAEKSQPGTVYSVIPVLRGRKPVIDVRVATGGKSVELSYDAMTGAPVAGAK
jgi:uncharacterized membrane protein YkoI